MPFRAVKKLKLPVEITAGHRETALRQIKPAGHMRIRTIPAGGDDIVHNRHDIHYIDIAVGVHICSKSLVFVLGCIQVQDEVDDPDNIQNIDVTVVINIPHRVGLQYSCAGQTSEEKS